jgi:diacylglycerol kinase family enzyme
VEAIRVFVNPHAGTLRSPGLTALAAAFTHAGIRAELHPVEPGAMTAALTRAVEQGTRVVAVAGGDGTMSTAASVLAGTRTVLALVPTGTLNHFARRLGIADLDAAMNAIARGHVASISVGAVNGHVFLNTATFGEYARVVRRRDRWRRSVGKWGAAGLAFIAVLLRIRLMDVTLDTPDHHRRCVTPLLWVGLGRGTFPRVTHATADLTSPELEVVLTRTRSRTALLRLLRNVVQLMRTASTAAEQPQLFEVLHTSRLRVAAGGAIDATLDGEVVRFGNSIEVSVLQRALHVLVPAECPARD